MCARLHHSCGVQQCAMRAAAVEWQWECLEGSQPAPEPQSSYMNAFSSPYLQHCRSLSDFPVHQHSKYKQVFPDLSAHHNITCLSTNLSTEVAQLYDWVKPKFRYADVCDKPVTSLDKTWGKSATSPTFPCLVVDVANFPASCTRGSFPHLPRFSLWQVSDFFPLPMLTAVNPIKFVHSVYTSSIRFELDTFYIGFRHTVLTNSECKRKT